MPLDQQGVGETADEGVQDLGLGARGSTVGHAERAAARARRCIPDVVVDVWPGATHALPSACADAVDARVESFHARAEARAA